MDVCYNNSALGPNVITFRTLLHLGPNVITFRTLLHLGQLLHLGLQQGLGREMTAPTGLRRERQAGLTLTDFVRSPRYAQQRQSMSFCL